MRNITFLIAFTFLSVYMLNAYPVLCKHFHDLKKIDNYPIYELVDQHQMDEAEESIYAKRRFGLMQEETFEVVQNGISKIIHGGNNYTISWKDSARNELNRHHFEKGKQITPISFTNGNLIVIAHFNEYQSDETPISWVENPKQSKLYFFDNIGNLLNQINLKYHLVYDEFKINEDVDRLFLTSYEKAPRYQTSAHSYLMKSDGTVIAEYVGIGATFGKFSEDGSYYLVNTTTKYLIDTDSGDIVTTYKTNEPSAVSDKNVNILAVFESGTLRIVNLKTKQLLFSKYFELPSPNYIEVTGDGNEVIFTRKNSIFKIQNKFPFK
jgi:hypothetical protein